MLSMKSFTAPAFVFGGSPSSDQCVNESLAFLVVEDVAVRGRAGKAGHGGPQIADRHTTVVGDGDQFSVRRQPRARAGRKTRIDPLADVRECLFQLIVVDRSALLAPPSIQTTGGH